MKKPTTVDPTHDLKPQFGFFFTIYDYDFIRNSQNPHSKNADFGNRDCAAMCKLRVHQVPYGTRKVNAALDDDYFIFPFAASSNKSATLQARCRAADLFPRPR